MEYDQLSKGYEYGLSKIYELVINNNPTYAYLLEANADVDQKLVMAHVFGHGDFFKNNYMFSHTNRRMMDEMANHATRVRRFIDRYGVDQVEDYIDRCLSLENLIDYHAPFIQRKPKALTDEEREARQGPVEVRGIQTNREYMRDFLNPKEFMENERKRLEAERDSEIIDYADHHSGAMGVRPGALNPYKLGIELFRDIEDRWNKGRFGKEYDEAKNLGERQKWDKGLGLGREKIFEVRRVYNDVNFIDEFMT